MNKIRIGIIGAGQNTKARHIPGLLTQEGVDLQWVCNRSLESGQRVAEEFDIPHVAANWREVVEADDVDAVVIGTWPYLHAEATCAALASGKHVMCEARMACNAAEAHAMLAAHRANPELIAQIVPSPFSLEVDATIKRLLHQENYVGELHVVEHRQGSEFLQKPEVMTWRQNRDLSGLNVMFLGIVYEMIMRWVGGAERVTAMTKIIHPNLTNENSDPVPNRIPEHVDVLATMNCGAQLHLQQSITTPLLEGGGTWLYGSEGVLRFHDGVLSGARRGDTALQPMAIPDKEKGAWRVEEEFIQSIRGREDIKLTTFEDGVKYMEFTDAVHLSMEKGRHISLPFTTAKNP